MDYFPIRAPPLVFNPSLLHEPLACSDIPVCSFFWFRFKHAELISLRSIKQGGKKFISFSALWKKQTKKQLPVNPWGTFFSWSWVNNSIGALAGGQICSDLAHSWHDPSTQWSETHSAWRPPRAFVPLPPLKPNYKETIVLTHKAQTWNMATVLMNRLLHRHSLAQ